MLAQCLYQIIHAQYCQRWRTSAQVIRRLSTIVSLSFRLRHWCPAGIPPFSRTQWCCKLFSLLISLAGFPPAVQLCVDGWVSDYAAAWPDCSYESCVTKHAPSWQVTIVVMTGVGFTKRQGTSKLKQSDKQILAVWQVSVSHIPVTIISIPSYDRGSG